MVNSPKKSVYLLEISCAPGGARRGEMYAYSRFEHLRSVLEQEFQSDQPRVDMAAGLAVFYGEILCVWVVQHGKVVQGVDLHPFLVARLRGAAPVRLGDRDAVKALKAREFEGDDPCAGAAFDIDWEGLEKALPPLVGSLAKPGDTIEIESHPEHPGSYLQLAAETAREGELVYGWNDLEGGEEAPEEFADPDPPSPRARPRAKKSRSGTGSRGA
jgi:hypothetical protein